MKAKHKLTSNDGFHENVVKLKYMELNIKKKYSRIILYSLFASKKFMIQPKYSIVIAIYS